MSEQADTGEQPDTIQLVSDSLSEEPKPTNVIKGTIHCNVIIIKSKTPGIETKTLVIPTLNRKLTKIEIDNIIVKEREKMRLEAHITDVSSNTISVIDDVSGSVC